VVDELGDFGGRGDIQTFDVTNKRGIKVRIVNVYDQTLQENNNRPSARPARQAQWDEMIAKGNVVVCGDFNAHSPWWNSSCSQRRSTSFLENLILKHDLEIINDGQPTRVAWNNNIMIESIIDVTLVRGGEVTNASAKTISQDDEDISSDHKMIEVEWGRKSEDFTNQEVIA
jgi:endonuclease/exonuclease/phosphatase family metal-dependent hydrolase